MALIDLFMRANQARRILFVADRGCIGTTSTDGFQNFLPNGHVNTSPPTKLPNLVDSILLRFKHWTFASNHLLKTFFDRNALYEQSIDPDNLDFTGTDLERNVSNKDALRSLWQEIWDRCWTHKIAVRGSLHAQISQGKGRAFRQIGRIRLQ